MSRKIIQIDEEKCIGCGLCVNTCKQSALKIIDGKAKLVSDDYCDGLGNCLAKCPVDAISFSDIDIKFKGIPNQEAAFACPSSLTKTFDRSNEIQQALNQTIACGCPSSNVKTFERMNNASVMAEQKPKHILGQMPSKSPVKETEQPLACGCAGSHSKTIDRSNNLKAAPAHMTNLVAKQLTNLAPNQMPSQMPAQEIAAQTNLNQWPVQIKLVSVNAPYFNNANLLIAADCTAYAYGNFHNEFMKNKITLIGCPKLDDGNYAEKLSNILEMNNIQSVTIVRMEVPCCAGLENAVKTALKNCTKMIQWQLITISTDGRILDGSCLTL